MGTGSSYFLDQGGHPFILCTVYIIVAKKITCLTCYRQASAKKLLLDDNTLKAAIYSPSQQVETDIFHSEQSILMTLLTSNSIITRTV